MEVGKSLIARLVLGYLKSENCTDAYQKFVEQSPYLKKYASILERGRCISSRIDGLNLEELIDQYRILLVIIDARLEETENYDRNSKMSVVDKLNHLLNYYEKHNSNKHPVDENLNNSFECASCKRNKRNKQIFVGDNEKPGNISQILSQTLLEKKELHEKLAEAINSSIVLPHDDNETGSFTASNELENRIKTIVQRAENDPIFDELLGEIIGNNPDLPSIQPKENQQTKNHETSDSSIKSNEISQQLSSTPKTSEKEEEIQPNNDLIIFKTNPDGHSPEVKITPPPQQSQIYVANTPGGILMLPSVITPNYLFVQPNQTKNYTENDILNMPTVILDDRLTTTTTTVPLPQTTEPKRLKTIAPKCKDITIATPCGEYFTVIKEETTEKKENKIPTVPEPSKSVTRKKLPRIVKNKNNTTKPTSQNNLSQKIVRSLNFKDEKRKKTKNSSTTRSDGGASTSSVGVKKVEDNLKKGAWDKELRELLILNRNDNSLSDGNDEEMHQEGLLLAEALKTPIKIRPESVKTGGLIVNEGLSKSEGLRENEGLSKSEGLQESEGLKESEGLRKNEGFIENKNSSEESEGLRKKEVLSEDKRNSQESKGLCKSEDLSKNDGSNDKRADSFKNEDPPTSSSSTTEVLRNINAPAKYKKKCNLIETPIQQYDVEIILKNDIPKANLKTPIKTVDVNLPKTPSGKLNELTPFSKVFEEHMQGVDLLSLPTPILSITPSFAITPSITLNETPEEKFLNRPTDYSTSSSYYQPSDTEQNKSLEKMLVEECRKEKTSLNEIKRIFNENCIGKKNLSLIKRNIDGASSSSSTNTSVTSSSTSSSDESDTEFNNSKELTIINNTQNSYSLRNRTTNSNLNNEIREKRERVINSLKNDTKSTIRKKPTKKLREKLTTYTTKKVKRKTPSPVPIVQQENIENELTDDDFALYLSDDENPSKQKNETPSSDIEAEKLVQGLKERGIHLIHKKTSPKKDNEPVKPEKTVKKRDVIFDIKNYENETLICEHRAGRRNNRKKSNDDVKNLDRKITADIFLEDLEIETERVIECTKFVTLFEYFPRTIVKKNKISNILKERKKTINLSKKKAKDEKKIDKTEDVVEIIEKIDNSDDDLMNYAALGSLREESPQPTLSESNFNKRKLEDGTVEEPNEKKSRTEQEALLKKIDVDMFLNQVHGDKKT